MVRRGALVLLLLAVSSGCGRVREVRACRELADLMNPVLEEIAQRTAKDRSAAAYHHVAGRYTALAGEIAKFDLGMPRSEKSVDDLGVALKEAGVQAKKLAEALNENDSVGAGNARRELGQLARLQKAIVNRIENDCL